MTPTLDKPIGVGNLYCETKIGTWTLITDIWVDEDGNTQIRIHDRLFPSVGRSVYDAWATPDSEKLTVTKDDLIGRIESRGMGLVTTDASSIKIQTEDGVTSNV